MAWGHLGRHEVCRINTTTVFLLPRHQCQCLEADRGSSGAGTQGSLPHPPCCYGLKAVHKSLQLLSSRPHCCCCVASFSPSGLVSWDGPWVCQKVRWDQPGPSATPTVHLSVLAPPRKESDQLTPPKLPGQASASVTSCRILTSFLPGRSAHPPTVQG